MPIITPRAAPAPLSGSSSSSDATAVGSTGVDPAAAADTSTSAPAAGGGGAGSDAFDTAPGSATAPAGATGGTRSIDARAAPVLSAGARAVADRITELVRGHTDRGEEREILTRLRGLGAADLNGCLQALELHELVESMDDRWIGPDNRSALFDLFRARMGDLSVKTRAALIDGAQRGHTGRTSEALIRDVFLATSGSELTALKNALDAGGDYHDLLQLLHHDIDDGGVRAAILDHIEAQAVPTGRRKMLSDIDDTLYANLKDGRFPKKTMYPGVRAFYQAISGVAPTTDGSQTMVSFLTARPEDRTGLVETLSHGMARDHGLGQVTVLSGDLAHVVGNSAIADKKLENFERYHDAFPEYGFVFVGDSGQGDAILASRMRSDYAGDVPATFIHDVVGLPASERAAMADQGVFVFDTYVGAAAQAFDQGLVDPAGLARVARAAREDFGAISFSDADQRAARAAELRADLEAANARLPGALQVPVDL